MGENFPETWDTQAEINYISKIGQFCNTKFSKKQLLRKYRKALNRRVNWGKLHKKQIIEHLDTLIGKL